MKRKVKFIEPWAHLGDPDDRELDKKYAAILALATKDVPEEHHPKALALARRRIADMKKSDRYGEKPVGFARDVRFKPGDEAMLNANLAEKLAECDIVVILEEGKKG